MLSHVWGFSFEPDTNVVTVYINALRKKLGADAIETVRGAGYRLRGPMRNSAAERPEPATPTPARPMDPSGQRAGQRTAFAIVLLTDIVDSTAHELAVGDGAWRQLLDQHDQAAHRSITQRGGRVVKRTGAGLLITLSEPSTALESAVDFVAQMADAEVPVRAGIHAGIIETRDDGDVSGITVNIAARLHARAEPNEILVTSTVRDLLLGSQFTFLDRGDHELKGLDGTWRIYAVAT